MGSLPDEIWIEILGYLEPQDVISSQRISPRLHKLARDNTLWRYKCFEKAPSASTTGRAQTLTELTGALGGLSLSDHSPASDLAGAIPSNATDERSRRSKRSQEVADWDCSTEMVDWYSEYISRHAPLSTQWLDEGRLTNFPEIRGIVAFDDSSKVLGPLEDGGFGIWDILESPNGRRRFRQSARTEAGLLFNDRTTSEGPSEQKRNLSFTGVADCISLNEFHNKAFVAVHHLLNEVDLNTLTVVSQHAYAWPITALSQRSCTDLPLTVGTTWSLNLYDSRVPIRDRPRSPEDMLRSSPADPEDSIAFLPNYGKGGAPGRNRLCDPPTPSPSYHPPAVSQWNSFANTTTSPRARRRDLTEFAQIEPGPLSILHQGENDIFIAGRFPSVLSYDRRYFPRLQNTIHSGARLSQIISSPYPPLGASHSSGAAGTLIACGEYGGRGSVELYSMPHLKQEISKTHEDYGLTKTAGDLGTTDREEAMLRAFTEPIYPFSYRNRVSASSSKLLSVAVQGTRIVYSDAEGCLKWVERDGRGLARRWNINSYELHGSVASVQGEQVVRRIIPLQQIPSQRGARGDGDLLVWTGERVGIVTTKPKRDEDELAEAFTEKMTLTEDEEKIEAHSQIMRRALERQADERIFMRRFT